MSVERWPDWMIRLLEHLIKDQKEWHEQLELHIKEEEKLTAGDLKRILKLAARDLQRIQEAERDLEEFKRWRAEGRI